MQDSCIQRQTVKTCGLDLLENGVTKEKSFLFLLCYLEDSRNSIWMVAKHGNSFDSILLPKKKQLQFLPFSLFLSFMFEYFCNYCTALHYNLYISMSYDAKQNEFCGKKLFLAYGSSLTHAEFFSPSQSLTLDVPHCHRYKLSSSILLLITSVAFDLLIDFSVLSSNSRYRLFIIATSFFQFDKFLKVSKFLRFFVLICIIVHAF